MRAAAATPLLVLALATLSGCGKRGASLPPEPRGPLPPSAVEARQEGERIRVTFTPAPPRGPKPSELPAGADLVRVAYAPGLKPPLDPAAFRRIGEIVASTDLPALPAGSRAWIEDPTLPDLDARGEGWTLRYAVQVRDRRGRTSALVAAPDLVPASVPSAPSALAAAADPEGVRLTWIAPPEPGAGFNIYRGEESSAPAERPINSAPIAESSYLDRDVRVNATYAYEVRAAAAPGPPFRESASSNRVVLRTEDRFPPVAPTGLVAIQELDAIRLFWNPGPEPDLAGYRIRRQRDEGSWETLATEPIRETTFLDRRFEAARKLLYRVVAVDAAGNESVPSEAVEVQPTSPAASPEERR